MMTADFENDLRKLIEDYRLDGKTFHEIIYEKYMSFLMYGKCEDGDNILSPKP